MTSLVATQLQLEHRLKSTDLSLEGPALVALVGPNGGGKTSLLRTIARVENAGGTVTIDGEDVDRAPSARRRRLLSFLPSSRDVRWPISVRGVIELGSQEDDAARIDRLVELFELEALTSRPANQLSTGERARMLMARAMAGKPRLLLLDEPLSNLDPYWVLRFLEILRDAAASGQLLLVALHDLSRLPLFDRALLIADGAVQLNKAPADLVSDKRFGETFRILAGQAGEWTIRRADLQSSR